MDEADQVPVEGREGMSISVVSTQQTEAGSADFQEWKILIDLDQLALIPKDVRPMTEQDGHESRKLWDPVTQNLLSKNWGEATRQKQVIEQAQRDLSAKRKAEGVE
jgi:hypothetical protein